MPLRKPSGRTCTMPGCSAGTHARELCSRHYQQQLKSERQTTPKRRNLQWTEELKSHVAALHGQRPRLSQAEIGRELGLSVNQVNSICHRMDLPKRPRGRAASR